MGPAMRRLRIAQVAPPVERVPPAAYGGTERVVDELTRQLVERGHDVAVFASGDSDVAGRLIPTVERALRPAGIEGDAGAWFATTVKMVVEQAAEFDIIHSHLEWWSIPLARLAPIPAVATFHGRLDLPWADRLLRDAPEGMVAISRHQASTHPDVPWTIIHNGLTLDRAPFVDKPGDAFCFVGRVDAEKGIIEAIDIALRAGRRLRIAAKVGNLARQRDYYESVFRPALQRAGRSVEYLGELQPAERDQLFADSYATLMPGAWPEPFGLVSIESLACGTPVLARRVGALPEIIREGVDGFFGDDAVAMAFFADRLGGLDRREIRERVIERFSAARMADRYEELYARMIAASAGVPGVRERVPDAAEVEEALAVQLPSEVTEPADAELPEKPNGTAPAAESIETEEVVAVAEPADVAASADEEGDAEEVPAPAELEALTEAAPAEAVAEVAPEEAEPAAAEMEVVAEAEPTDAVTEPESPEAEPAAAEMDVVAEAEPTEPVAEAESPELEPAELEPAAAEMDVVAEAEPAEGVAEPQAEVEPGPTEVMAEAMPAEMVSEAEPHEAGQPEEEAADVVAEVTPAEAIAEPEPIEDGHRRAEQPEAEPAEVLAAVALDPAVEAAVVDVVVADQEAPAPPLEAVAVGSGEPRQEPGAAEAAEAVGAAEAATAAGPVAVAVQESAPAMAAAPRSEARRSGRPPVAVGPGPGAEAPMPAPQEPAVPSSAAPSQPASIESAKPPAAPAAKRPSRSISIFTRSWTATSGKAAGARRRDPS